MTRFLSRLFGTPKTRRTATPAARTRLGLERLDDRLTPSGGYQAMDIPGQGVFVNCPNGGWLHPTTADASHIAVNEVGKVAMDIPGQGVFVYYSANNTWVHPTTADVTTLDIDEGGKVAMDVPGQGVFVYYTAYPSWVHPTSVDASEVRIAAGRVAMEIPGQGVWVYDTPYSTWRHLTPGDATSLDIDTNGDVVVSMPGLGVYLYKLAFYSWERITPDNASVVRIAAPTDANPFNVNTHGGEVVMEIPGEGVWVHQFDDDTLDDNWTGSMINVDTHDATSLDIDTSLNVVMQIPPAPFATADSGVIVYNPWNGNWTPLTTANASVVAG
jgi:hypothetical protein